MLYLWLLLGFVLPLVTTVAITPALARRAARRGWVDAPDSIRKLHSAPTPTVGGLAIAAGVMVGVAYVAAVRSVVPFDVALPHVVVWTGALGMVAIGFYDDVKGLSFRKKLAIQALVAYLLLHVGYRVDISDLGLLETDPYNQTLHSMTISMLWIIGIMNAINLLDGLDGLAGGVVLIAFSCMAFVYGMQGNIGLVLIGLLMIGALAGFLIHNFNPASIFMGDSGSLFLGFSLAAYTLAGEAHTDPVLAKLIPVVALGLPLLDTTLSIVRRVIAGRPIFAPDHDHLHHRLVRRFSPRQAVLVLYGVALYFGSAAILMFLSSPSVRLAILCITALLAYLGIRSLGYLRTRPAWREIIHRDIFSDGEPDMADRAAGNGLGDGAFTEAIVASVHDESPSYPADRPRGKPESVR